MTRGFGKLARGAVACGLIGAWLGVAILDGSPASGGPNDQAEYGAPAYFQSDINAQWDRLIGLAGVRHIVVQDPQNFDATRRDYIDRARARSIRSYGYVSADYAPTGAGRKPPKSPDALRADIARVFQNYPNIDGVFVDEVLNNTSDGCSAPAAWYREIYTWFKSTYPSKTYVLNPGTALCDGFAAAGDIFLIYENNRNFYYAEFKPYYALSDFDWLRALPNNRVWMIMYGVTASTFDQDVNDMADTAGVIWIDPDTDVATVYNALPQESLLATLAQRATRVGLPAAPPAGPAGAAPPTTAPRTGPPPTTAGPTNPAGATSPPAVPPTDSPVGPAAGTANSPRRKIEGASTVLLAAKGLPKKRSPQKRAAKKRTARRTSKKGIRGAASTLVKVSRSTRASRSSVRL